MKVAFRTHDLGVRGLDAAVRRVKENGIDAVQLVTYKFMDEVKYAPGQLNAENSAMIGKALKDAGIGVALVGAYFNPVHSDLQKAERCKDIFKEYLKFSSNLGCNVVGSETGSFNDDKWSYNPLNRTEAGLERVIKTFKELAIYAKGVNAFVGIEGAAGHVCWNVQTLKRAIDGINEDNVKVIFDLYNYLEVTNYQSYLDILDEGLKTFAGKLHVFHIKDCVYENGKIDHVAPGKGLFDFEELLGRIKAYDKDATLVLEGTTGDDVLPSVELIRKTWDRV